MRVIHLHPKAAETSPFVFTHSEKKKTKPITWLCFYLLPRESEISENQDDCITTQATKSLTSLHLFPKHKDSKWNFYPFVHSFKFHRHRATQRGPSPISIASVKATATEIRCKYTPPQIFCFPLRGAILAKGKPKESVTPASAEHRQHGAPDWEPAPKRQSSRSAASAWLNCCPPPSLNHSLFTLVRANPPVTWQEVGNVDFLDASIFPTPYISTKRTTLLEAQQLEQAQIQQAAELFSGNKSSPKNPSRLRLLTPEDCSCLLTFALVCFSSPRSGWLSGVKGDSRVARVPHSLLDVSFSVSLWPTGIVPRKPTHRGTVLYPEFGMNTLDIWHVLLSPPTYFPAKTCRTSFEKAAAQWIKEI